MTGADNAIQVTWPTRRAPHVAPLIPPARPRGQSRKDENAGFPIRLSYQLLHGLKTLNIEVPRTPLHIIRPKPSLIVLSAEIDLGLRVALISGLSEPHHRLRMIPRHTVSSSVHEPKIIFGRNMALIRGLTVPGECLATVLPDAMSVIIRLSGQNLGSRIALISSLVKPSECLAVVLGPRPLE
jgi:hypothetical protein